MKIYTLSLQNNIAELVARDYKGIEDKRFNSKYIGSKRNIITEEINLYYEDIDGNEIHEEEPNAKFVNISYGRGVYYFDNKAYEVLKDLFDDSCEFYSAKTDLKEYKMLYVNKSLTKTFDYEKTQAKWSKAAPDKVIRFIKYSFNEDVVKNKHIFRIEELSVPLYVSDEFRQRCIDNNITGLDFRLVYDSDDDNIQFPFEIV